jgi:hypothetical protein
MAPERIHLGRSPHLKGKHKFMGSVSAFSNNTRQTLWFPCSLLKVYEIDLQNNVHEQTNTEE